MSYINSTLTQPTSGTTVSSIGDENNYISLILRRLGAKFELVTELTVYFPISGHYECEELDRQIIEDEDDAIEAATDMEYAAVAKLNIMDVADYWKEPGGFPETLDRIFQTSLEHHTIAAE
jgi:hypothetical protein